MESRISTPLIVNPAFEECIHTYIGIALIAIHIINTTKILDKYLNKINPTVSKGEPVCLQCNIIRGVQEADSCKIELEYMVFSAPGNIRTMNLYGIDIVPVSNENEFLIKTTLQKYR